MDLFGLSVESDSPDLVDVTDILDRIELIDEVNT